MPKKMKGAILNGQARELVSRLRDYFEQERQNGGPLLPVNNVLDRVSQALNVSKRTICVITKEKYGSDGTEENTLTTPSNRKKRKAPKSGIDSGLNTEAIRNHVNSYYDERNEVPTIPKLLKTLKEAELFDGCATSLSRLLNNLGFQYRMVDNKRVLVEAMDIVSVLVDDSLSSTCESNVEELNV